jgi:hypothetical protein
MIKKLMLSILAGSFFFSGISQNPSVICSSGDNNSNTNIQITWSIGEVVIETISTQNQLITQGFNQGEYIVTAIKDLYNDKLEIKVYPNPASDFIILNCLDVKSLEVIKKYKITDLTGRLILEKLINQTVEQIDLSSFSSGTYLLSIENKSNNIIKSYQIIKK